MLKTIFFSIPFLLASQSLPAQEHWKLEREKNNIKIYTSELSGSKLKAVKVECELKARPAQLVALILDVAAAPDWVYHTKSAKLIKTVSPSEIYYHSEVSLPWPLQNRDFVAHLKVTQDPKTKIVSIDGPAISGMVPLKKGIVRITNSKGKWLIKALDKSRIQVTYTLHVDPAGNLPSWLVNMFAAEGPSHIFQQLRIQLEKPRYKAAQFPFLQE